MTQHAPWLQVEETRQQGEGRSDGLSSTNLSEDCFPGHFLKIMLEPCNNMDSRLIGMNSSSTVNASEGDCHVYANSRRTEELKPSASEGVVGKTRPA